ncbi:ABC transporter ATP-binding protein [Bacillus thuringiensis]|uniref:ABC transporter ATP-binding protein n=1 Tax=Bacillus thuringiensis TaxID=1428 RepID=UPI003D04C95F
MLINSLIKSMSFVWKEEKLLLGISIINHIIRGFIPISLLWASKNLIDSVSNLIQDKSGDYESTFYWLILQFFITLMSSALHNIQEYIDRNMEHKLDHSLQKITITKTTSIPVAYFDLHDFYNTLNRNSSNQGNRFLSPIRYSLNIFREIIGVSSLLIYLFSIHWSLGIISLSSAIPIFIVNTKFSSNKYWLIFQQTPLVRELNYISYILKDRITAKEIRIFGLGPYLLNQWSTKYLITMKQLLKLLKKQQISNISLDGLTGIFYTCSALILVLLSQKTTLTIGEFIAIGQAVQGSQAAINNISKFSAGIHEQLLYISDFFKFVEYENKSLKKCTGTKSFPTNLQEGIRLENVTFQYPQSERKVLENISLHIKPKEKIAIVGENGSGKTTFVKCLMGLYPITDGEIFFDDVNMEDILQDELYKNVTAIFQDFIKYPFSVYDNIAFGNVGEYENRYKVENVSAMTGANKFINNFKDGYSTYLGKNLKKGEDISGGEWQKIALSRALFRNGQIFILDEPTAALDPKAEMEVFNMFDTLTENKTTIFISHRMASARIADRIVVFKDGRIIETGTHDELMGLRNEYYKMYQMQSKWYLSDETKSLATVE